MSKKTTAPVTAAAVTCAQYVTDTHLQHEVQAKLKPLERARYHLQQAALGTYGTIIDGQPQFLGYFREQTLDPKKSYARVIIKLHEGLNCIYTNKKGQNLKVKGMLALRDWLFTLAKSDPMSAPDFIKALNTKVSELIPNITREAKQKEPVNALADSLATVLRDFDSLTADQLQTLAHAIKSKKAGIKKAVSA